MFQEILNFTTPAEITTFFEGQEFKPLYEETSNRISSVTFDDRFEFNFGKLVLENLSFNIEIDNKKCFDEVLIKNNNYQEFRFIKFCNIKSKIFIISENSNIDIEIENCELNSFAFQNNINSRRLALKNVKIENNFLITNVDLRYIYIEKCLLNDIQINKLRLLDEGFFIKESTLEKFIIGEHSEIDSISLKYVKCERMSFSDSKIFTIVQENTTTKNISFSGIDELAEISISENCVIENLNLFRCAINNFLMQDDSKIKQAVIQKSTSLNAIVLTDNCTISLIEFLYSRVSTLIFHRGIKISYFYADDKSIIGNLDILDGSIKSLVLSNQNNSYTFQSTEIGFLQLDNCKINSLNIRNGCKIEAYVTNCIINKIDFKQNNILKDTLISFSGCEVYSVIMENFSVAGNLHFRALKPLNKVHNDEWFDSNKYDTNFRSIYHSQNKQQDKHLKEYILQDIRKKSKGWVHTASENELEIRTNLINRNYFENKLSIESVTKVIELVKEAYVINKTEYQKKLIREIKRYNEKQKNYRTFTEPEKSNYEFNFNIIEFIWDVIENIHTQDLEFQNINTSTFRVYQSSLGKTEFSNCDLGSFELQYNSGNFYDCLFLGTDIPDGKLKILNSEIRPIEITEEKINKIDFFKQRAEFYNQFKKIFEKQGNVFNAGIYNSKWAENQEKLLLLSIGKKENYLRSSLDIMSFLKSLLLLFKIEQNDVRQDIFTFNLNRISNKHGESWIKTILFLLVPIVILFFLYITSIYYDFIVPSDFEDKNYKLVWNENFLYEYKYHWKELFSFLNPARRLDFFKPIKGLGYTNFSSNFIDFSSRIILAFGIYQLIAAFRKNAKKN